MVKKFQINLIFSDKMFYTLIVLGVIILLAIGVYAYGSAVPSTMGHSPGEIEVGEVLCEGITGHDCGYDNDDQTCAEVSGCVQNAITDGNTGWDNSYGFITDGNTNWNNAYNLLDKDTDSYCSDSGCGTDTTVDGCIGCLQMGSEVSSAEIESYVQDYVTGEIAKIAGYEASYCGWYAGKVCPVKDGEKYVMSGYSSTQVECCGSAPPTCEPYDWTTYNTYCGASCGGLQCGSASGVWKYAQRRVLQDSCKMETRVVSGNSCTVSCGGCSGSLRCIGGVCKDWSH